MILSQPPEEEIESDTVVAPALKEDENVVTVMKDHFIKPSIFSQPGSECPEMVQEE